MAAPTANQRPMPGASVWCAMKTKVENTSSALPANCQRSASTAIAAVPET